TIATAIIHLGSVVLGATVAAVIPANVISIVAGLAFFAFAIWPWRGDVLGAEDEERASRQTTGSVILTVGTVFFLAELGDTTMLAAGTLAPHRDALGTG